MKVQITYREVQYFENIIEVEMTKEEYKAYLKMSEFQKEQKYDLCASTGDANYYGTEPQPIIAEIIK
jgi:hypothetical protein